MISKGETRRKRHRLLRDIRDIAPTRLRLPSARESLRLAVERYIGSLTMRAAIIYDRWPALSPDDVDQLARSIEPSSLSQEVVSYFRLPKGGGRGWRQVCKFPSGLVVRHILIRDVLEAVAPPGREQFLVRGRGHRAAVLALKNAIESGCIHVLTAHIKNAFASVNFDAIYRLDVVPAELIRASLDPRHLNLQTRGGARRGYVEPYGNACVTNGSFMDAMSVPTGLLGGSSVSGALFAWLLRDIGECAPAGSIIIVFSDNIAIASPTRPALQNALDNLVRFVADHPAGPFTLTHEVGDLREGFDFLGHHFTHHSDRCSLIVEPSYPNFEKMMTRASRMTRAEAMNFIANPELAVFEATRMFSPYAGIAESLVDHVAEELMVLAAITTPNLQRVAMARY